MTDRPHKECIKVKLTTDNRRGMSKWSFRKGMGKEHNTTNNATFGDQVKSQRVSEKEPLS